MSVTRLFFPVSPHFLIANFPLRLQSLSLLGPQLGVTSETHDVVTHLLSHAPVHLRVRFHQDGIIHGRLALYTQILPSSTQADH